MRIGKNIQTVLDKGSKLALHQVERVVNAPLRSEYIRPVAKKMIKTSLAAAGEVQRLFRNTCYEWDALIKESRSEMDSSASEREAVNIPIRTKVKKEYSEDLNELTYEKLYSIAQELTIEGRSEMNKSQLIEAIEQAPDYETHQA